MRRLLRALRSTVMLLWLCAVLAVSALALGIQALTLSAQVASVTAGATAAAVKHRKDLAKAVARTKAKARLQRALVAVPIVGTGAAVAFEAQDFHDWQVDNPNGTLADYSCEVAALSAEVVDEVLQDLPDAMRPSRDLLLRQLPECETSA